MDIHNHFSSTLQLNCRMCHRPQGHTRSTCSQDAGAIRKMYPSDVYGYLACTASRLQRQVTERKRPAFHPGRYVDCERVSDYADALYG